MQLIVACYLPKQLADFRLKTCTALTELTASEF